MDYICLFLFVGVGLFNIIAAVFNFNWYFNSGNIRRIVSKLGRGLTRIFYAFLGLLLIAYGVVFYTGLVF